MGPDVGFDKDFKAANKKKKTIFTELKETVVKGKYDYINSTNGKS